MKSDMQSARFSGFLFYSSRQNDFWSSLKDSGRVKQLSEPQRGWSSFFFQPSADWLKNLELPNKVSSTDLGLFSFFARRGEDNRLLLVSSNKSWVSMLLQDLDLEYWLNNTPTVNVSGLLIDLMSRPRKCEYSVGTIWARVEGFGQDLTTISLHGKDVPSASLFSQHIAEYIVPFRVSLRDISREIISIGDRADVSFNVSGSMSLLDVDNALRVVGKELGHLDWSASNDE